MNKFVHAKKSNRSAAQRVLRAVGIVFFAGWVILSILLLLMHASWREFVGSALLLGGFFISWVLTVYVLHRKDPKYVDELLNDIGDEEGKRQEKLVKSDAI